MSCGQVLETLVKIRRHDPSIYSQDVHFFPPASESDGTSVGEQQQQGDGSKKQKDKPMYLREVIAKQVKNRTHACSNACDALLYTSP